jgi:hypothetical protein
MKVLLFILCISVQVLAQADVCKRTSNVKHFSPTSVAAIREAIHDPDQSRTLLIEVQAGTYDLGETGIRIRRNDVCLFGVNHPILKRTKFSNEKGEPAVIKISSASSVVVKGFEIQGTISLDNRDVVPAGISVVNFDNTTGVSNIRIESNTIHTIGQFYDYNDKNGLWRYKTDHEKSKDHKDCEKTKELGLPRTKFNCGQAYGIHIASNENPISQVFIRGNTLKNLRLGESEAITIGERISEFDVSENTIYDVDNIAIDIAGKQDGQHQSSYGTVRSNTIYGLKGACENGKCEGGQNSSYPFVAGIYIDGGTGLSWERSIQVTANNVTDFGIGISVGSENNFCNSKLAQCNHVQVQFVELTNNILRNNQVYGIGVGKDSANQNSQTWNVKIVGNKIIGNVLDPQNKGYSQLHFGSLEANSLKFIEVTNNVIQSFGAGATLLVRVYGDRVRGDDNSPFLTPDVRFEGNVFYSDNPQIWCWGSSKDTKECKSYSKTELVLDGKTLNLPAGVVGEKNVWTNKVDGPK